MRWVDVYLFDGEKFIDDDADEPDEFSVMVTHWADLANLNWNDGVPFNRIFNQ